MNILVWGHIDHGKTTTVYAMNKILKQRFGIDSEVTENVTKHYANHSIVSMIDGPYHAAFEQNGRQYHFIDLPFLKIVRFFSPFGRLTSILLFSSVRIQMAQCRRQKNLRQYGIEKLAVYMNKMDMIDETSLNLSKWILTIFWEKTTIMTSPISMVLRKEHLLMAAKTIPTCFWR